jgi:hypothetical protein
MSNWPFTEAISSGLTASPGVSALTLAPCSMSASTDRALPCRAAKCSAVRPPCAPDQFIEREAARDTCDAFAGRRGSRRRHGPRCGRDALRRVRALCVLSIANRVLQLLFRRRDAGQVDHFRRPRRIGAMREQLAHGIGAIERRGKHQRGLAVGRLHGVGVGRLLEQEPDRVSLA